MVSRCPSNWRMPGQRAAPRSTLENLYGPTELTVACTLYRWNPRVVCGSSLRTVSCRSAIPFRECRPLWLTKNFAKWRRARPGELLMSGPQVTPGYWCNPEATARSYVSSCPDRAGLFYRTGDRVRRPAGGGAMTYVGRIDHQIKVLGFRVELGEVEATCAKQPGVMPPLRPRLATDRHRRRRNRRVRRPGRRSTRRPFAPTCARELPALRRSAGHPRPAELPTNANGKIDRQALSRLLRVMSGHTVDEVKKLILSCCPPSRRRVVGRAARRFRSSRRRRRGFSRFIALLTEIETRLGCEIDFDGLDPEDLTRLGPLARYIAERV